MACTEPRGPVAPRTTPPPLWSFQGLLRDEAGEVGWSLMGGVCEMRSHQRQRDEGASLLSGVLADESETEASERIITAS